MKSDSLFVEQMFSIIDHDGNGYISFRELLYAVLLFAQGLFVVFVVVCFIFIVCQEAAKTNYSCCS